MNVVWTWLERCRSVLEFVLDFFSKCTTLSLRFYYDHEDLSTMLPRCLYEYGASTTLFLRLHPDSCRLRSRYANFEHVQNKRSESVELPDHEDPAAIILRLWRLHYVSPAICHDRPRFRPIFDRSKSGVYVWTGASKQLHSNLNMISRQILTVAW